MKAWGRRAGLAYSSHIVKDRQLTERTEMEAAIKNSVNEGDLVVDSYVVYKDGSWHNSNGMDFEPSDPLFPVIEAISKAGVAFDGLYLCTDGESFIVE